MIVADAVAPSVRGRIAEPGRLWIRHSPRAWPGAEGLWVDFAEAALGVAGPRAERLPELAGLDFDDLLYLPPVPPRLAAARLELTASLIAGGTPVLVQLLGDLLAEPLPAGAIGVVDLLPELVAGDLAGLSGLPPGSRAVWPLVAGVTDAPAMWENGCARLAAAGVAVAQPLLLDLDPPARRQLAQASAHASYDRLFHGLPPSERAFSIVAHRHGLRPFLERPLPAVALAPGQPMARPAPGHPIARPAPGHPIMRPAPASLAANRRAAGRLALAGELWLRLGREEAAGQELLGAARRLDRLPHDVAALAREGNLGLLDWLGARGRSLVEQSLANAGSSLVDELLAEYLRPEPVP